MVKSYFMKDFVKSMSCQQPHRNKALYLERIMKFGGILKGL